MEPGIDEVWYLKAYQTDTGKRLLAQKVKEGKIIMCHRHNEGEPCSDDCEVVW